jgi:hypothetical protein
MTSPKPADAVREWWIGERLMDAHPMSTWDEDQNYFRVVHGDDYDRTIALCREMAALLQKCLEDQVEDEEFHTLLQRAREMGICE